MAGQCMGTAGGHRSRLQSLLHHPRQQGQCNCAAAHDMILTASPLLEGWDGNGQDSGGPARQRRGMHRLLIRRWQQTSAA